MDMTSPPRLQRMHAERGFAVVMAMLVVALAASVAGFMAWQQSLWVRQAENLSNLVQAEAIARAAGRWAQMALIEDARTTTNDHLGELWATALPAIPVEHGSATIRIVDLQGRFNVNNLVQGGKASAPDVAAFRRLLELAGIAPDLANAVVDWIDADSDPSFPGGAEDIDYLAMRPPYRAANRPLIDIGELARVKGFDAAALAKLAPFVAALPAPSALNLNTAPAEVLSAVIPKMGLVEAQGMVASRRDRPFLDANDVKKRLPELDLPQERFGVSSQYFLAAASARFDRATVAYDMLIARPSPGRAQLVWQKPVAY
jgi:general secretion pathway protein K